MAGTTSKIVTYEEWLKMPETEGKNILKSQLDLKLYRVLTIIFDPAIRQDPLTCSEPDPAVFNRKNIVKEEGHIHSTPELLVELLSPGNTRRDMIRKTEDDESIGAPELWTLSPEARTFEVLQLQDGKGHRTQLLAEGRLRPLRFPEAVVDIASVWPD
jgi:Uma2 family endonuclease